MEKYGILTEDSHGDFNTKKAEYIDEDGYLIADKQNKHKLKNPSKIDFEVAKKNDLDQS
jgi:hypothetical protein